MGTKHFCFISILLLFSTCKDPYDIKSKESVGNLVVDGIISDGPGPYFLKLGSTNGILFVPLPLTGAKIKIMNGAGQQEGYQELGQGKYQLAGTIVKGLKGEKYMLDILLPDGRHYQSSQEIMPTLQASDTALFKVEKVIIVSSEGVKVERQVVNIYMAATLPPSDVPSYFRWTIDELYRLYPTCFPSPFNTCPLPCYVPRQVSTSNMQIVQSRDFSDKHLSNILLQSNDIDYTFLSKHYFNVSQYSMNIDAYNYWKKVQQLVERTGSIFDTPPANLRGNVHNLNDPTEIVFGYFEASLQKVNHVGVAKGYITVQIFDPCKYRPGFGTSYTPMCMDCTTISGSSNVQPSWFE